VTVANRRLLLLFALALVAVGAFSLYELPRRRAEDRSRDEAATLFAFDPGRVDAVVIDRPDTKLRFELRGTQWVMLAPLRDDAEAGTVMPVISNIDRARVIRDLGHTDEPSRFGLDEPSATIRLLAGRDTLAALELGSHTVDRSAVYARRPDGNVLLVPTAIHRAVTLDVQDYRNRRVIVLDIDAVRSFTIDSSTKGRSTWVRHGADWFTVAMGDSVRGDSVAVPAVLRRLRGMRVRAFVADVDTTRPLVSVTIHKNDGSIQAVSFFAAGRDSFLARTRGNARTVEIADDPSDIAGQSLESLRDRRVLQFDPLAAHRITITTPDTTAVIVRAGDTWALPNPALGELDAGRATDLVRALRALRYTRLLTEGRPDPRGDFRFSLVIDDAGGTILEELYGTPVSGGSAWIARSRSLGRNCEIEGAALDAITGRLSRLRR